MLKNEKTEWIKNKTKKKKEGKELSNSRQQRENQKEAKTNLSVWRQYAEGSSIWLHPDARLFQVFPGQPEKLNN